MILAGDIGGTNTRLALFERPGVQPIKGTLIKYPSRDHKSLEEILVKYVGEITAKSGVKVRKLAGAGFGVAGPVRGGKVKTTNLPWNLDAKRLAKLLKVKSAVLVNDLYATAAGIEVLSKKSLTVLRKGAPPKSGGTRVVTAPGTGLGHASLVWTGERHIICPSEAGHCEFAPTTELESRLRNYIAAHDDPSRGFFKRCSYENVCSGPGLVNIYTFLVEAEGQPAHPEIAHAEPKARPGIVSATGLARSHSTTATALDLFVSILARQSGNMALACVALGGIYLGGGIPPRILPLLQSPAFLNNLSAKGSQKWMDLVPVHVITDDLCALYGAGNVAGRV
jgi:glucokinase